MADKKKGKGNQLENALENALSDLGLEGEFSRQIRLAVVNGWTMTEFLAHVAATKTFRRTFPGLIVGGNINEGFGTTDLLSAVDRYRQFKFQFEQMAGEYGQTVDRKLLGTLMRNNVAPEEFQRRLSVNEAIKANPSMMDYVNESLKQFGYEPLDAMGLRKFLGGVGSRDFYDVYEAARLRQAGIDVDPLQAAELARGIGEAGAPANLEQIIAQVKLYRGDIGPELTRQGITEADLVTLEAGADPKGLTPVLQSILANRRAQGTFVAGTYAQRGTGGGVATLPTEEAPSAF